MSPSNDPTPRPARPPGKAVLLWQSFQLAWHVRVLKKKLVLIERSGGGIGDLLCLLASVPKLRDEFPGCWLVLATDHLHLGLARCTATTDQVIAVHSRPHRLAMRWVKPESLRTTVLPDECTPPRPRPRIPLTTEFARTLRLEEAGPLPTINVPRVASAHVDRLLVAAEWKPSTPLIVVHTGPTWRVKEWPATHWRELRSQLAVDAMWVQVGMDTFGPRGRAACRVPGSRDLVNRLTLEELAAVIAKATVFVGIDSGPVHIAAASRVPIVAIYGPTDPECFLPMRPDVAGLHSDPACIGCHHHADGPRHWRDECPFGIRCMHGLSPARVAAAVFQLVSSRARPAATSTVSIADRR